MKSALQQVEWESCLVEPQADPALQSYARQRWGFPNPIIAYFSPVPWLARAQADAGATAFLEAEGAGRALAFDGAVDEARAWLRRP